jgi:hypothetical protein
MGSRWLIEGVAVVVGWLTVAAKYLSRSWFTMGSI